MGCLCDVNENSKCGNIALFGREQHGHSCVLYPNEAGPYRSLVMIVVYNVSPFSFWIFLPSVRILTACCSPGEPHQNTIASSSETGTKHMCQTHPRVAAKVLRLPSPHFPQCCRNIAKKDVIHVAPIGWHPNRRSQNTLNAWINISTPIVAIVCSPIVCSEPFHLRLGWCYSNANSSWKLRISGPLRSPKTGASSHFAWVSYISPSPRPSMLCSPMITQTCNKNILNRIWKHSRLQPAFRRKTCAAETGEILFKLRLAQ